MEEIKDTKIEENKDTEIKADETSKTYTQAEHDREISKMYEKLEEKFNKRAEQTRAEATKLANMNAEERLKYELEQREKTLADKEREWTIKENKYECSKILQERGLPISFADFAVDESADKMKQNLDLIDAEFKKVVKAEIEKRLGSTTPKTSTIGLEEMTKEKLAKLPYAQQMAYLKEHPDFL